MKKEDAEGSVVLFVDLKKKIVYYMDSGPLGGPIYGYDFNVVVSEAEVIAFNDFMFSCIDKIKESFLTYSQRAIDEEKFIPKKPQEQRKKLMRKYKDLLISSQKQSGQICISDRYGNQLKLDCSITNEEFFDKLIKWLEH